MADTAGNYRKRMESNEAHPVYPERQLVASVLSRAIMDLASADKQEREGAFWWIQCDDDGPFSFRWACEVLFLDSVELIRELSVLEHAQSLKYYNDELKTERRPWRERVFQLS